MAENKNLSSILVKSGLISIFINSPVGYFSEFPNVLWMFFICASLIIAKLYCAVKCLVEAEGGIVPVKPRIILLQVLCVAHPLFFHSPQAHTGAEMRMMLFIPHNNTSAHRV